MFPPANLGERPLGARRVARTEFHRNRRCKVQDATPRQRSQATSLQTWTPPPPALIPRLESGAWPGSREFARCTTTILTRRRRLCEPQSNRSQTRCPIASNQLQSSKSASALGLLIALKFRERADKRQSATILGRSDCTYSFQRRSLRFVHA
jgi:hypothetical protein